MGSSKAPFLCALAVFKNVINEELIRSCHIYKVDDGKEMGLEREFLFSANTSYVEMAAQPLLKLSSVKVSELCQGKMMGVWLCMLAFNINHPSQETSIPSILAISRNPKLKSIPTLIKDLQFVNQLIHGSENTPPAEVSDEDICEGSSERFVSVLAQDLNSLPYAIGGPSSSSENQPSISPPEPAALPEDTQNKKKKRAVSERIAELSLEDLVKYFDLPISEASRNLKVGLTVLKRKCRELGIPRWPHRKIKSLDSLINDLQEEAERQERKNTVAAMAVKKRKKMLENEKENIEKKPFTEIESETKRFRQDVFKRRHRARNTKNKS